MVVNDTFDGFPILCSTVASGLNALAAVTLVDIVKPWRHWRTGQAESVGLGTAVVDPAQDFKDTVLSKVLSKYSSHVQICSLLTSAVSKM